MSSQRVFFSSRNYFTFALNFRMIRGYVKNYSYKTKQKNEVISFWEKNGDKLFNLYQKPPCFKK